MAASQREEPDLPTPASILSSVTLFLRRNWRRIGTTALLLTPAFFATAYSLRQYTATAVIAVDPRGAKIFQNPSVLANIGPDFNAIESIVQVTKSEGYYAKLVDKLDLVKDAYFGSRKPDADAARLAVIDKLSNKIVVNRRGTSYVIDVGVSSPSPEKSAEVANAAAQIIVDEQTQLRTGASTTTAREIEQRLSELRDRVSRAEQAFADTKAQLNVTDTGQGGTLLERRVFELNQQLVLASARTAEARARYELLRRANTSRGDNLPQTVQSAVLTSLRTEYAQLTRQAADQATVLGPRHPAVASLNAQIADVRRQIGAEIARMMTAAHNEYLQTAQIESSLSAQLKSAQAESGELGPKLVRLAELEREAKAERGVYEQFLARQRELAQVKDLEPSDIRIVSRALPPTKTSPALPVMAAGAIGVALLVGLLYALFREWRSGTLKTVKQAERLGAVAVVGFLPKLVRVQGKDKRAQDTRAPDDLPDLTPWLGDLCAELKERQPCDASLVLFVTSAGRGEGRSTVAANLATFLGEGGDRVLLIEADRKTNGRGASQGLLDVLDSGEDLRGAFIEMPEFGFTLLPFGGRDLRPSAVAPLMSGMTLRATFKLARQWFDVIVIDGPPALEAQYARLLADQADETLFVIEWDKTGVADADAATERLDVEEVAVVYNKVDPERLRLYDPPRSLLMSRQAGAFADAA